MIGDVVGHGIRAATTMSELRNALRAFALEGHSPAATLHQLDRVVHATLGPGVVATVLFMIIDAAEETVSLASAGHPPPALRGADGRVRFLEPERTPPLGVDASTAAAETRHTLETGDTLLLFTDGLVERRRESITEGLQRLSEAFAAAPADVEEICDQVLQRTLAQEAVDDDVALLAVRLVAPAIGPLQLTLPASAGSVPLARHRLRTWLQTNAPGLDRITQAELEVAWSEACTNVVRHAYGPRAATFEASATVEGAGVSLQIRDRGHWRPPRGRHGGLGMTLMRQLSDEVKVAHDALGTTVTIRRLLKSVASEAGSAS
jgi:anti-sigma regulatory factor (Ser/Thr protein kinase)